MFKILKHIAYNSMTGGGIEKNDKSKVKLNFRGKVCKDDISI